MDLPVLIAGTICLLVITWCLECAIKRFQARHRTRSVSRQVIRSDPAACAQILACTGYNNTGAINLYSHVKSRAIPNERLVRAFEIDNSFTTSEAKRRMEFNSEARKAIRMTEAKWQDVADFATELVRQIASSSELTATGQTTSICLDSSVRSVCLKIVLQVLFQKNPLELDDGSIGAITGSINKLWIQSKGNAVPKKSDQHVLQQELGKIFPGRKWSKPHENPLNLIIPAYESLWRVVLSGFLQVCFVEGTSHTLRSVLARFLANPTVTARKEPIYDPEAPAISVDHIVKEALRLYPSVKRVYRQFNMENGPGPEDVAADIEACQRSETIWGADAHRFVPSRWINASDEARKSYMAFGVSPFVCPAKVEFGPMMIGILVAAFAGNVSSDYWCLKLSESSSDVAQCDLDKALSGEEPLVSDRSTYEGIRILRK